MLKKLLVIITVSLFFLFPIFADERDDLINELTQELENSTSIIEELTDKTDQLEDDKLVLEKQIEELVNALEETTASLEESTSLIEEQKDRIETDQEEIISLRERLQDFATDPDNTRLLNLSLGITYPLAIQIGIGFKIPKLPIGFFINTLVIPSDDTEILFGGGLSLNF